MGEINIGSPELSDGKLISKVSATKDIDRFIWNREFFVEYDDEIYADDSILNIPVTAAVLPLAWLSESNVIVGKLDEDFKISMDKLSSIFKQIYPLVPFKTEIISDELVKNKIDVKNPNERTGLLFSGGVDSSYSLINNLEKKPRLIMHWGVDGYPYPQKKDYWERTISAYSNIAKKLDLKINVIKTNVLEILHNRRMEHHFHKELYYGSLWLRLQFTPVLASLTAPLSVNRFDKLIIASSHDPNFSEIKTWGPTANEPITDHEIKWSDLSIKQDGYIYRFEKMRTKLEEYSDNEELLLRVCNKPDKTVDRLNCSSCEKCYRTIVSLILSGIDPNSVGFQIDESTPIKIEKMFRDGKLSPQVLEYQWGPIIRSMQKPLENDIYEFNRLFEWLKYFHQEPTEKDVWRYRDVYMSLPWLIAKGLDEIYKVVGINIHEHSPIRKTEDDS